MGITRTFSLEEVHDTAARSYTGRIHVILNTRIFHVISPPLYFHML
jgi:hypothetical protein